MDPILIRQELARLLEHPLFARAKVLREILLFLGESAIAGRHVDELILASQVFGIPAETFHPYKNANVRVQMRNLRLKLEAYAIACPDAPVKCKLAGYELVFEQTETISAKARRALTDARCLIDSRFPEDLILASQTVQGILAEHPRWATAWETLNYMQISMAAHGAGVPRRCLELAEESADRALEIAPVSGQAHAAKASVEAFLHWKWADAERLFDRAIALDETVNYHGWYHAYLVSTGRVEQTVPLIEQSICAATRPAPSFQTNLGVSQYLCRRLDVAEVELQRAHKINPNDWSVLAWLATVQWTRGSHVKAAYTQTRAMLAARRSPPQRYFELANEGLLGTPRPISLAEEDRGGVSEVGALVAAVILHNWNRAIDAMERMQDARYPLAHFFPQVPLFDPLWQVPRFRDLFLQTGLPLPDHAKAARAKSA